MKVSGAIVMSLAISSFCCSAADIECSGNVAWVMADHASCVDANGKKQLAFKVGSSNYWFCSNSDSASSLILAAKMASKPIVTYMIDANGGTCATHTHYLKPSYIILQ